MIQHIASVIILQRGDMIACICRENTTWYDGYYALPGGRVEVGESFTDAAIREAKEEIGVDVKTADLEAVLTVHLKGDGDDDIWTNVVFRAHKWQGEPFNAEPHKSSEFVWQDVNKLPKNTVPNTFIYLKALAAGQHYIEAGWSH